MDVCSPDDGARALDPARGPGPLLEDAARDDEALYLAGALVDLRDPRVAVIAFHRMVLHVPVAAKNLDGVVGNLVRSPRGVDRKSTRRNSSHANISYAVFCLKKTHQPPSFW